MQALECRSVQAFIEPHGGMHLMPTSTGQSDLLVEWPSYVPFIGKV